MDIDIGHGFLDNGYGFLDNGILGIFALLNINS